MARYEKANNAWIIVKYANGGTTTLGADSTRRRIADVQTTNVRLEVSGTTTTIAQVLRRRRPRDRHLRLLVAVHRCRLRRHPRRLLVGLVHQDRRRSACTSTTSW